MSVFRTLAAVTLLALPMQAGAQEVGNCEWQAAARNLVEPWEANTRTFANGDVRLAVLDTIEPAAAAFHMLILSPPRDELGGRQCRTIGMGGGAGFAGMDFAGLTASYDPAKGLLFAVPVQRYRPATADFGPATLSFTLNQATGVIEASLR